MVATITEIGLLSWRKLQARNGRHGGREKCAPVLVLAAGPEIQGRHGVFYQWAADWQYGQQLTTAYRLINMVVIAIPRADGSPHRRVRLAHQVPQGSQRPLLKQSSKLTGHKLASKLRNFDQPLRQLSALMIRQFRTGNIPARISIRAGLRNSLQKLCTELTLLYPTNENINIQAM